MSDEYFKPTYGGWTTNKKHSDIKYIDSRKLLNDVRNYCKTVYCQPSKTEAELQSIIDRQPSVDLYRIVHCNDCTSRNNSILCPLFDVRTTDDFFCKGGTDH